MSNKYYKDSDGWLLVFRGEMTDMVRNSLMFLIGVIMTFCLMISGCGMRKNIDATSGVAQSNNMPVERTSHGWEGTLPYDNVLSHIRDSMSIVFPKTVKIVKETRYDDVPNLINAKFTIHQNDSQEFIEQFSEDNGWINRIDEIDQLPPVWLEYIEKIDEYIFFSKRILSETKGAYVHDFLIIPNSPTKKLCTVYVLG